MNKSYLNEKGKDVVFPILDSSLINATKKIVYNAKIVECGDYLQVYFYENKILRKTNKDDLDLKLKKQKIDSMFEKQTNNINSEKDIKLGQIEQRNITRSKIECQRLAKCNSNIWETFITLTFAENITDVKLANKQFKYFIDKVKRVKKDFKYLCIPEFQKRGAIHYHLLTNININDTSLIYAQEDNKKFKHIKYWNNGFTSIEVMKGDVKKIVGYISKYMTKDIDNRLFSHHRYFYSRNLNKPLESYIDLDNEKANNFFQKKIQDKTLIFTRDYLNSFDDSKVNFLEFIAPK